MTGGNLFFNSVKKKKKSHELVKEVAQTLEIFKWSYSLNEKLYYLPLSGNFSVSETHRCGRTVHRDFIFLISSPLWSYPVPCHPPDFTFTHTLATAGWVGKEERTWARSVQSIDWLTTRSFSMWKQKLATFSSFCFSLCIRKKVSSR